MWEPVRQVVARLSRAEKGTYSVIIAGRVLLGLLDVVGIVLVGVLAGVAANGSNADGASVSIAGYTIPHLGSGGIVALVIAVLAVFILKAVAAGVLVRAQAHFVARLETKNVGEVARYLLGGTLSNLRRYSKAQFQFALTGSMTYAFTGLLNNVAAVVAEGFLVTVIAATFIVVSAPVAIFALVYFGGVVVLIQVVITRRLKRSARAAASGTIETTNLLSDTVDTYREISVLQQQVEFAHRIRDARSRVAHANASLTFLGSIPRYVLEATLILGVVILVAQQLAAHSLEEGFVTVGVFIAGGARMMGSLLPLQNAFANLKQNGEQARVALGLMREEREFHAVARVRAAARGPASQRRSTKGLTVRLSRVSYRYPEASTDAIRGISLRVAAGTSAALVGPSGAGKTTLVDLILGLLEPDSGVVELGGREPGEMCASRPGIVAYVPQRPGLVSGSIVDNIALGVPPDQIDWDAVNRAVRQAQLGELMESLPDGLHSSVGRQANSLSGGQIQRIGLARALYAEPALLVLDEATSGLDAGAEAQVTASLQELKGSVTVLVIAHRLSTVQHADTVHVIEGGRRIASGDFASISERVPLMADYVRLLSFENAGAPPEVAP